MAFKKRFNSTTTRKSKPQTTTLDQPEDKARLKAIKTLQSIRRTHKAITAEDTLKPIQPVVPKIQQDQLSRAFQNTQTAHTKEL